jgi:hypothetical protein
VDIKKQGRIPDDGGHRVLGKAAGNRNRTGTEANRRPGCIFLHNAVDDHSRPAYAEILPDEEKETAPGFWERANAYFESRGITVKRVLTDNGACYRCHAFSDATSSTHAPAPTVRRPTAKPNASTAPCSKKGPMQNPILQKPACVAAFPACSMTTITTEDIPHSKATHPPAAYPTSQGIQSAS